MKTVIKENLLLYGPALISGILLIFCFPKADLYLIAWIALVPFLMSLYNKKPGQAFYAGFLMGLPYFFGTLYWIYYSINHYGGISFINSILVVILLCMYLSLYTGIFGFVFAITIQNTKLPALLLAPAFWTVLEFARSYAFTGFPWSSLGYSQYKFLSVIQIADITGIYGVSFLIAAVNGALTDVILLKKRISTIPLYPRYQIYLWASSLTVLLLFTLAYGQIRLHQDRPGKYFSAGIIQGNIEQDKKWDPAYQAEVIGIYKDLSLSAASSSPEIIIWPETALPFFYGEDAVLTNEINEIHKKLDTFFLFGSVLIKEKKKIPYLLTNSAVMLDRTGKAGFSYDKIHMVPFGEYVPLRKVLFFIDKLVTGIGDYTPGKNYIKAHTPSGDFAVLICYEIIFPGLVRKFYSNGGDYIVTITNDAWFGKTSGPYQHFSMAVFRAVENRKPVIRAANTGISGFIDSSGRILYTSSLFERTALKGDVRTDTTRSFYSRYGDLFSYIWIVFTIILFSNILGKIRKSI